MRVRVRVRADVGLMRVPSRSHKPASPTPKVLQPERILAGRPSWEGGTAGCARVVVGKGMHRLMYGIRTILSSVERCRRHMKVKGDMVVEGSYGAFSRSHMAVAQLVIEAWRRQRLRKPISHHCIAFPGVLFAIPPDIPFARTARPRIPPCGFTSRRDLPSVHDVRFRGVPVFSFDPCSPFSGRLTGCPGVQVQYTYSHILCSRMATRSISIVILRSALYSHPRSLLFLLH